MNKKLVALAMVPILIGMSGVFAFSALSGSSAVNTAATGGNIVYVQYVYWNQTNSHYTTMTVSGNTNTLTSPSGANAIAGDASNGNGVAISTIGAAYFEPGTVIGLRVTLYNTGTGAMTVTPGYSVSGATGTATPGGFYANVASNAGWYAFSSGSSFTISPGGHASYYILIGLGAGTTNPSATAGIGVTASAISAV